MFDVGQKVICVRKEPWKMWWGPVRRRLPVFREEVTVMSVIPEGSSVGLSLATTPADAVTLEEYPRAVFEASNFRPKEPNIEALRSLLVSKKQSEKV